jgi:hypothetical protein
MQELFCTLMNSEALASTVQWISAKHDILSFGMYLAEKE